MSSISDLRPAGAAVFSRSPVASVFLLDFSVAFCDLLVWMCLLVLGVGILLLSILPLKAESPVLSIETNLFSLRLERVNE